MLCILHTCLCVYMHVCYLSLFPLINRDHVFNIINILLNSTFNDFKVFHHMNNNFLIVHFTHFLSHAVATLLTKQIRL